MVVVISTSETLSGLLRAVVAPDQAGWRLDRFLAASLLHLSRSRLQALIEAGQVVQGGRTIRDVNFRVKPGEAYEITVPAPVDPTPGGEDIPLTVVYEDK